MIKKLLAFLILCTPLFAQTGNACSTNTSAATGSIQSYGLCQPGIISGRNAGGWIALNRTGDQSNGELQCYNPSNVFIQGGIMTLELRHETQTCHYYPAVSGSGSLTNNYTSAFVQWNTFSFTGGTVQVRFKGPSGAQNGAWPAIWLLGVGCEASSKVTADNATFAGQTCNWPTSGEVDIFEQTGGGTTTSNCAYFDSAGSHNPTAQYNLSDSSANWHVVELRWNPGSTLTTWLDGVQQTACNGSAANLTGAMFLQINIATNPSGIVPAATPSTMQVDWVKVCRSVTGCSGNGGDILFYDDFVPPTTQTMLRPLARMARTFASVGSPPNFNLQINGKVTISGQTVLQ